MKEIMELVDGHRAGVGQWRGICSVCCSHRLAIKAVFLHVLKHDLPFALIEATCNQVNQSGGYTGMTPLVFRGFVFDIANEVGLSHDRILLGGDHLGPNPWTALKADEAMIHAEVMVADYVAAGFRKIHLDCSMPCADDPAVLPDALIAARAARLCAIAEQSWCEVGGDAPVYVIGTEVPVPGGATEELQVVEVTLPRVAAATIDMHRVSFERAGLRAAWDRVIGLVVQPGVEFDHARVLDYAPEAAAALSSSILDFPHMVFEAHSTDYQRGDLLARLVHDHFAILKVGPWITFALREALWALDSIEREWRAGRASGFRERMIALMETDPRHWANYYHSDGGRLLFELQYSLSDRIRYYWPRAEAVAATETMMESLSADPPPLPLISQYLPAAHAAIRRGEADADRPEDWVIAHIWTVLDIYQAAVRVQAGEAEVEHA